MDKKTIVLSANLALLQNLDSLTSRCSPVMVGNNEPFRDTVVNPVTTVIISFR